MRRLGVVLLFGSVLSVPKPSLWDSLDKAGAEISNGFNQFGATVEKGFEQGVNTLAHQYDNIEHTLAHEYDKLEDTLVHGFDQFGNSISNGYNRARQEIPRRIDTLREELPRRMDSWGINQNNMMAVQNKFQNSLQSFEDVFRNHAQMIREMEMPDVTEVGTNLKEKFTPFFNYNQFTPNFGFNNWINTYARKWWEGDNVCVTREEVDSDDIDGISVDANINLAMQISKCEEKYDEYTCQFALLVDGERKAYKTTYSCCRGFKMDENKVCKEFDIKPVEETIADLNGADFLSFLSEENLLNELKNSTIFLPDNDAIDKFRKDIERAMLPDINDNYMYNVDSGLLNRRKRDLGMVISQEVAMKDMLLGHVATKVFNINEIENNEIVDTKGGSQIRMSVYNTYPKKTVLANCALITSKDHHTESSTIHVIDRIITPATKTIGEILKEDTQFRTFVDLLGTEELEKLSRLNESFTVFAPSEIAFQSLDELWKAKIGLGQSCSQHILTTHILPTVVCSSVVAGRVQVSNNVNERMELRRDESGKIFIEDREIIVKDVVGKNGVIHVIQSLILPKSAQTVTQEIKQRNGQRFLDLLEKTNLMKKLDEMKDFTLLLPSSKAMNEMDSNILDRLDDDTEQLENILLHHFLPKENEKIPISRRTSSQKSMAGVKHNINHNTISCARLESRSTGKVCRGSVVEVDRLLVPPGSSLMQLLASSSEHSQFLQLLEKTKLSEKLSDGHFTVFAPTNHAFDSMPDNLKSRLLNGNLDELRQVLQLHVIPDIVCCSSAPSSGMFPFTSITRGHRSLAGHTIMMTRSYEGHVQANGVEVNRCDTTALNGLLHSVNNVILPRHMQQPTRRVNVWDPFSMGF